MNRTSVSLALAISVFANLALAQQTDFFWSTRDLNTGAVNQPLVLDVEPGETGSLYLYYTSNGPSDLDINVGAMLDIATSQPGIIKFTDAEVFDFAELVSDIPIGFRWDFDVCPGNFTDVGTLSDFFINEWGAFTLFGCGMVDATTGGNVFQDAGFDRQADAFLFGRVDFEVIAQAGCVQIQIGPGKLGIAFEDATTNGELADPIFGSAYITLDGTLPGETNDDGPVDLLDVNPFIQFLLGGEYFSGADTNCDGVLNLLDVNPFVSILTGEGLPVTDPSPNDASPGGPIGDVNDDGMINIVDVAFFRCILFDCGNTANADINQSGNVDLFDLCPMFELLLSIE